MEQIFAMDSVLDAVMRDQGPKFTEYKGDPAGAIQRLLKEKKGEAIAVWTRPDLGSIDLIYGSLKGGIAHIQNDHPEFISKLPDVLKNGTLHKKTGARKVFLVDDSHPRNVIVVSLDWYGSEKTWIVTGYEDQQGMFTGELETMNTQKFDSLRMEIPLNNQRTNQILGTKNLTVKFDDAGVPDVAEMLARAKLTKELRGLKSQITTLGQDPISMLKAARLAEQLRKIRKQLGATTPAVQTPEPAAPEVPAANSHIESLKAVAAGQHDGEGIAALFGRIQEAANALNDDGQLIDTAEQAANDAITHWAELEERLSAA